MESRKYMLSKIALFLAALICIIGIGLLSQSIGIKYTNPSSAAIILSLEAVFGVIFSILVYKEEITIKLFLGFVFIFIAIVISETRCDKFFIRE